MDEKDYQRRPPDATVVSNPEIGLILDWIHGQHQKATKTILNPFVPEKQKPLV